MTTITVARKNGQVAIAADTLTSWGTAKESAAYIVNHQKILRVQDTYLAVSGPAAGDLILRDYFARDGVEPHFGSIEEIFATWQEIAELGVQAGAEFDDGSGLPVTSYVIALAI